jgi:CHAT domain-containing protein
MLIIAGTSPAQSGQLLSCFVRVLFGLSLSLSLVLSLILSLTLAFASASQAGPPSGEKQIKLIGEGRYEELAERYDSLLSQPKSSAADLHGLCYALHKIKKYNRLNDCLQHLQTRIKQGDIEGRLFGAEDVTPYAALLAAEAANELGDYARALDLAEQALVWYEQDGDGEILVALDALAAMVVALTRLDEKDAAWSYLHRLDKIKVGGWFSNDSKTAKSLALARSYMALGAYEQAYDALKKDTLFKANVFLDRLFSGGLLTGNNLWLWQDVPRQYMLGKALLETGQKKEASERLKKLLKLPQIRQNGEIYWQLLYDLGQLAEADADLVSASDYYRRAIEVIELHRLNIDTEVNKIGFAADRQAVYGSLVDVLYRRQDYPAMFEFVERGKARALVDLLANKWQDKPPSNVPASTAEKFSRYHQLDEQTRYQSEAQRQPAETPLVTQLATARNALQQVDPMFASLVSVPGIDFNKIRARLQADESLLAFYAVGPILYLLVLDTQDVAAYQLDASQLHQQIADFRNAIGRQDTVAVKRLAKSLYDLLLRPASPRLRTHLTLVPHSPLHYLPFAALHDGQDWLLKKHSVRMLPSAGVEDLLASMPKQSGQNMLIFANPATGTSANDLPNAELEAQAIARQYPDSRMLTRAAASERALRSKSTPYRYIHLATHGKFQSSAPLKSFLLLAADDEYDGLLTVDEIYGLKLNADLVSLSACETGLGRGSAGDDVVGLVRGFFYSGARSLLASYWAVDDQATSELMQHFYANLKRMNKRDALRNAQLATLAQKPEAFYWASFYLTGLAD